MGKRDAKSVAQQSQEKTVDQPNRSSKSKTVYHVVFPFNFFAKLPDLARQNLTRQMKLQDLILLSFCSKRCAMAIRISRVPSVPIKLELKSDTFKISLPDDSFCWYFEFGEFETENVSTIKNIPVTISQKGVLKTKLKKNLDVAFNTSIAQILYIIPSSEFLSLFCHVNVHFPVDFHCKTALAGIAQVKKMCLYGYDDPSDNIKYVLENIHATRMIVDEYHHKDTDTIDNKLVLMTPDLYFRKGEFLKPLDHFPSTSTESAKFCTVRFDEKEFIKFLKWFKSVPAERIRNFKGMKCENWNRDFEMPDLTEFGVKKCNLKLRARYFPGDYNLCCALGGGLRTMSARRFCTCSYIDTEEGLDIMRSDGLLGTILDHGDITFLVWHERFPEQPKNRSRL